MIRLVYLVTKNTFSELRGEGLVLGFDERWQYQENSLPFYDQRQIILIGSDGISEAEKRGNSTYCGYTGDNVVQDNILQDDRQL